jgi:hypothetical protein
MLGTLAPSGNWKQRHGITQVINYLQLPTLKVNLHQEGKGNKLQGETNPKSISFTQKKRQMTSCHWGATLNQHPPAHQSGVLSTGWGGISHLLPKFALTTGHFFWCWPLLGFFFFAILFFLTLTSPTSAHITCYPPFGTTYQLRIKAPPYSLPTRSPPPLPHLLDSTLHPYAYQPTRHTPLHAYVIHILTYLPTLPPTYYNNNL